VSAVFKYYYNTLICMFVILLVFQRMYSLFIVSWTSTYKDYDMARFRLRVSVEYISSVESYIFNRIK
jgi:hypothetical protein